MKACFRIIFTLSVNSYDGSWMVGRDGASVFIYGDVTPKSIRDNTIDFLEVTGEIHHRRQ